VVKAKEQAAKDEEEIPVKVKKKYDQRRSRRKIWIWD
jgi:hypothetical protein